MAECGITRFPGWLPVFQIADTHARFPNSTSKGHLAVPGLGGPVGGRVCGGVAVGGDAPLAVLFWASELVSTLSSLPAGISSVQLLSFSKRVSLSAADTPPPVSLLRSEAATRTVDGLEAWGMVWWGVWHTHEETDECRPEAGIGDRHRNVVR